AVSPRTVRNGLPAEPGGGALPARGARLAGREPSRGLGDTHVPQARGASGEGALRALVAGEAARGGLGRAALAARARGTRRRAHLHRGLTPLVVQMPRLGLPPPPPAATTRGAWFNAVFWDAGRVPRAHMVSWLTEGWQIAITSLAHERGGSAPHAPLAGELRD